MRELVPSQIQPHIRPRSPARSLVARTPSLDQLTLAPRPVRFALQELARRLEEAVEATMTLVLVVSVQDVCARTSSRRVCVFGVEVTLFSLSI